MYKDDAVEMMASYLEEEEKKVSLTKQVASKGGKEGDAEEEEAEEEEAEEEEAEEEEAEEGGNR